MSSFSEFSKNHKDENVDGNRKKTKPKVDVAKNRIDPDTGNEREDREPNNNTRNLHEANDNPKNMRDSSQNSNERQTSRL